MPCINIYREIKLNQINLTIDKNVCLPYGSKY